MITDSEQLAAQVAVVTGAAGRIGRATVHHLAGMGARVVAVDIDKTGLDHAVSAVATAGGIATGVVADLADPADRATVIPRAVDRFGQVDILVNNAAYHGRRVSLFEVTDEDWEQVMAVNLTTAMVLSRDAARDMINRGRGVIVNITAVQHRLPLMTFGAYGASKGGLAALTRYLAVELAPHGIRVNAIQPGVIAAPEPEIQSRTIGHPKPATLLGREGTPDEVAAAVAFLAGADASFITGAELPVDGGRSISRLPDPLDELHRRAGGEQTP